MTTIADHRPPITLAKPLPTGPRPARTPIATIHRGGCSNARCEAANGGACLCQTRETS
jgi:hypothetical protein